MKAVILAAATSPRLLPFSDQRAKPLTRIAGRTLLECTVQSLVAAGITEVVMVVNHRRETIQEFLEHGRRFGISVQYVVQEPLEGIGHAIQACRDYLREEAFLLLYGDVLATGPFIERIIERYMMDGGAVAGLSLPKSSQDFGNVYLNPDMRIARLVEKPSDPHLSNYVFAGGFVLPRSFLDLLDQHANNAEACFQALIQEGRFTGADWEGDWIDVRWPWDILEANRMLMKHWNNSNVHQSVKMEGSVVIEGAVHIEENVRIGSGTVLKGPCYIGAGSYIGNNALIRQFTSLGPQSVVGFGTELKNCVLFGRSTLGRLSYIGDSVIGERVMLGTGVTTVNIHRDERPVEVETEFGRQKTGMTKLGAFIGDDANIGAHQVMAPGTVIPCGFIAEDLITLGSEKA